MKLIIIFCVMFALVNADYDYAAPLLKLSAPHSVYGATSPPSPPSSSSLTPFNQFFTQDTLGQYSYGYNEPLSAKQEYRTVDGTTVGSYKYLDATGKVQTVDYTADAAGFRVAATNLPRADQLQPVTETAEVAELRAQHLAAHEQVKLRLASPATAPDVANLPQPVEDTPEVAAAKVEFFKLFEAEKQRHKLLNEQILLKNQQQKPLQLLPESIIVHSQPILVRSRPLAVKPASVFAYVVGAPARDYLPAA